MRGKFHFMLPSGKKLIIPNLVTDIGERLFLKMITQADVASVPAGGNWYVGLCSDIPVETDILADITTELTSAGGYARQPIVRDSIGWPDPVLTGDGHKSTSAQLDFVASGADFSSTFTRAFLTNVLSGTAGKLFAYSGLLPNPVQVLDGQTHSMKYELFAR